MIRNTPNSIGNYLVLYSTLVRRGLLRGTHGCPRGLEGKTISHRKPRADPREDLESSSANLGPYTTKGTL